jgi:hypothetical protein
VRHDAIARTTARNPRGASGEVRGAVGAPPLDARSVVVLAPGRRGETASAQSWPAAAADATRRAMASPPGGPYIPARADTCEHSRARTGGGTVTTRADTRRRHARHAVAPQSGASVEVDLPKAGGLTSFVLVDLSHSGVSFRAHDAALHCLDTGTRYDRAVVRLGECVIRGELVVMHVTPEGLAGALCGALFYPESDAELVKLKSAIAGMEALGRF